ncbi:MAG: DPP IV N-terminal domain-containing protein [Melioribacteraceae bacterium]|nr:DPP IV N-terminal domain-containing protein [Melioribacteraceae bacterium]
MKKLFLLLLIITSNFIFPQNKLFTVEDVIYGTSRRAQPFRQINWLPNSDNYAWIEGTGENQLLLSSKVNSSKIDTLTTIKKINAKLKSIDKPLTNLNYNWTSQSELTFWNNNIFYTYNLKSESLSKTNSVNENATERFVAPNNKFIAYTIDNNLLYSKEDGKELQITFDKDTNVVNGQSVHRNEFGINHGIFWSPNSNYIAFYRMDQSMVTDYPLVDISTTPAKLKNIKYPMAGQTSHQVKIGIYDINKGTTTWLKTGEPLDQYLTCLTWQPDEKYFYVAHLNKDQNHLQLKKYDVSTGELVKILFEEKNDKYVEPENELIFLPNNNEKFLWQSQRDGFNHIYLYDTNGNLIKQITKGNWVVTQFNGFDETGKNIFITSTKESPIERHFYRVNLTTGEIFKLTNEVGTHTVIKNSNCKFFIDSYSNVTTPRIINIINSKGEIVKNILTSENPYKEYKMPQTKLFSIKNDEGIELYCRMILPTDFDSTKKYPVIFYVYGGPHAQEVNNIFGMGRYFTWFYLMAQKGFIVFTLDNRGSSNRGLEFEQATFRRLGTIEIKDQMTGVNYLKKLKFVDENRFGVYGWSYGGFMTTSLMLRTNNTFKVGACGGAVIDWKYYEIMYGERYMDTPQSNPDGYNESCLLNYVQNLNGKLLLVHGTSDPTVVWQHTLAFVKKAQELNKPLDYFPYVGHGHGVVGKDAIHLYNKITNYFLDNL